MACCDEALACQAGEEAALKAWLRRSKANLGRHEYEVGDLCCSRQHLSCVLSSRCSMSRPSI